MADGLIQPVPGEMTGGPHRPKGRGYVLSGAVAVCCLAIIGGVGYFVLYPQAAAAYHWRRAQDALADLDLARAHDDLRRCLAARPADAAAHFLMARTCRRADRLDEARGHLTDARRIGWPEAQIELEVLLAEAQSGQARRLEATLQRHLRGSGPDEGIILEALVRGYLRDNFLEEAYRCATAWIDRHPADWPARFWRGQVLARGLKYDLAAEDYLRALDRKPDHAPSRLRAGEALLASGRYAEAAPHFRAYLQHDPRDPAALLGLARCLRSLGPPEEARACLERLFAQEPQHPGALVLRGQLGLDDDKPEEALRWLREAEAVAPRDLGGNQALATALRQLGRKQEAQEYERKKQQVEQDLQRMEKLTEEVVRRPLDAETRYEIGALLIRLGKEPHAARWLASALAIDPAHPAARRALADCLPRLTDPTFAERCRRLVADRGGAGPGRR
jgi:tetratricopeptide (TPR) repeat protein